ncbi:MAG: hypothetical protein R3C60_14440, partial [Parvularculaceae bacterium]
GADAPRAILIIDTLLLNEADLTAYDRSTAYQTRASCKVTLGDYAGGLDDFKAALDASGLPPNQAREVSRYIGYLHFDLGHYREAIDYLAPIAGPDSEDFRANLYLATAYVELGDYQSAEIYALRAAELKPENQQARAIVAKINDALGGSGELKQFEFDPV